MSTKLFTALAAAIIASTTLVDMASASPRKPMGQQINVGNGGVAHGRNAQARGGNDNYVEVNRRMPRGSQINVGNGGRATGRGANASGGSGNTVILN